MYTIEEVNNPEVCVRNASSLVDDAIYEKLLIMYEPQKDKEQNQIQLMSAGKTISLSPQKIYLHLKYKTSFAVKLVEDARDMESVFAMSQEGGL